MAIFVAREMRAICAKYSNSNLHRMIFKMTIIKTAANFKSLVISRAILLAQFSYVYGRLRLWDQVTKMMNLQLAEYVMVFYSPLLCNIPQSKQVSLIIQYSRIVALYRDQGS